MADKSILSSFNGITVLVLGDVMIDRYLYGGSSRMSPEAPVPVVNIENKEERLGGAANVALNIKAMGANPILCSVVGKDEGAESLFDLLENHDIPRSAILQSDLRKTTVKTRIFVKSRQVARFDEEDQHYLDKEEEHHLLQKIRSILDSQKIEAILFQDYNKGVLSLEIIRQLLNESKKRKIPTAVDPKYTNFFEYKGVSLFKPNLREVKENLHQTKLNATLTDLQSASEKMRNQLNNKITMITLSDKGIFIDAGGAGKIIPTKSRDVADVCGAGDTVISIATLGLATNMDIEDIANLANIAGGQVCEQVGVVPINKHLLEQEYQISYSKKE